jgi:hypothetical protein
MEELPPRGSIRRRVDLALFAVLTLLGAGTVVYGIIRWIVTGQHGPILVGISGLVCFVVLWRWIIERIRSE